jgi:hypothetical protein
MRTYKCFYKGKTCVVVADTSLNAQGKAQVRFKASKRYDITVVLCDVPVDTASL